MSDLDLPADLQRFRPPTSESLLRSDGNDPADDKAVKVFSTGVRAFRDSWSTLAEGVADKAKRLKERGWSGDELRNELESTVSEGVEATLGEVEHRRAYLERRRAEASEELTDYASAPRMPEESEFREYLRSLDGQERLRVLNEVASNGSSMARRAVLRPWVPPQMAGLQDEEHRERLRDKAHRAENPEAAETSRSLGEALEALDRTEKEFRQQAHALVDYVTSSDA